jgi:hypothetical protein
MEAPRAHFRPPSPWASACSSEHLPRRQSLPTQRSQLGWLGQIVLFWNATTPATRRSDEDRTTDLAWRTGVETPYKCAQGLSASTACARHESGTQSAVLPREPPATS